ncbi:hypothetical protein ACFYXS_37630 [Streptomyces sp. NPDC002574]|uniref:hypothetical protein n=1 Tax=Streptomyces sp. NPDC002574 TaxID=3364652 RepID=UPI00369617E8
MSDFTLSLKSQMENSVDCLMGYSRIKSWVQGFGGSVDYVDYVKGNGDLAVLVAFSHILFPRFIEVDDCILWERVYEESNYAVWRQELSGDKRKIEATLNRLHIWGIVESEEVDEDRKAVDFIAECAAKAWRTALTTDFPDRPFDVQVVDSPDGPVVTFCSGKQ